MNDHDRDAILARRSMFISAALAGLACVSPEPTASSVPVPVPVPVPESAELVPPQFPPTHESLRSQGPRPQWSEIIANAPPLDVPEHLNLSERERQRLLFLAENERQRYETIATYWNALPTPETLACEDWEQGRTLAAAILRQRPPTCGPSSTETHTYVERRRLHASYLAELSQFMLPEFEAAILATCSPDRLARRAPRVCLSCGAPQLQPIIAALSFAADDAQADTDQASEHTLQLVHDAHQSNRDQGARLIVRGHADPSEAQPEALARARAETVVARLLALGVARDELEIRVYGVGLPISRDPERAGLNRRVDFEVLPAEGEDGY